MTILIHFHQSHYRTFKAYSTEHVQNHLKSEFPGLVSYPRFVALIPSVLVPRLSYLQSRYARKLLRRAHMDLWEDAILFQEAIAMLVRKASLVAWDDVMQRKPGQGPREHHIST